MIDLCCGSAFVTFTKFDNLLCFHNFHYYISNGNETVHLSQRKVDMFFHFLLVNSVSSMLWKCFHKNHNFYYILFYLEIIFVVVMLFLMLLLCLASEGRELLKLLNCSCTFVAECNGLMVDGFFSTFFSARQIILILVFCFALWSPLQSLNF